MNVPQSKAEIFDNLSAFADSEPATIVTANDPAYVAIHLRFHRRTEGRSMPPRPHHSLSAVAKGSICTERRDRFAMLSGLAYSHLHRDVFTALSLGATLYIPNPSEARSPEHLAEWLGRNAITVLHLTPALGQLLLTSGDARLPSVRRVFFGGDILTREMVASVRRLAPNATVGSFYGATETQRAVGYFEIANDLPSGSGRRSQNHSIGPRYQRRTTACVESESAVGGHWRTGRALRAQSSLGRRLHRRREATKQMFIVNPFTNDPKIASIEPANSQDTYRTATSNGPAATTAA